MIDTAALTAAVETLQEYCEQVRLVMNARGYPKASVRSDIFAWGPERAGVTVWLHPDSDQCEWVRGDNALADAFTLAESLTPAVTPNDFAATIGIAPDGRLLEAMEG